MKRTAVLRALVRKETIELLRDPVTLAVAVLLPFLMLFLFGYAMSMDVRDVRLVVYDADRSPQSVRLLEAFSQSGYFVVHRRVGGIVDVEAALDRGEASVGLVIPEGFSRALAAASEAEVRVVIDGSFSPTALIVAGYAIAIIDRQSTEAASARFAATGLRPAEALRLEARVWYNAPLRSANYIVPGLFAVLLMAFPPMLTALAIVHERERGTIEQIYVSPVEPAMFVLGKTVPYAVLSFGEMLLVLAVGTWWFDVPMRGSGVLLVAASLLYVFVTVGLGVAVSAIARTQVAAVFLSLVGTLMPSFLFSGFLFPIGTMPYVLQLYTYVFPARYFNDISRDIYLKGIGLDYIWGNVALLAVYAMLLFVVASISLRKKVAR